MKMYYGGTPINSLKVKHYEMNTNDCDMVASDLQAGKTAVARGRKITGTGKCFSFAMYGKWKTNLPSFAPEIINVVQIGSSKYPIKTTISFENMKTYDFTTLQQIAEITIDGVTYPVSISIQNGMLTIICDQTIDIELFYGRDEYI